MKFYSDIEGNRSVWTGSKSVPFVNGIIETTDPALIDLLKRCGYRNDGVQTFPVEHTHKPIEPAKAETVVPETDVVTDWSEMTKNDLVKELVKRGVDFNKRQNKDELIALLEA